MRSGSASTPCNAPVMVRPEKLAALKERMEALGIREQDLEESFVRGSGHGGQKVNKTNNCVYLKHLPTGIAVKWNSTAFWRGGNCAMPWNRHRRANAPPGRASSSACAGKRTEEGAGGPALPALLRNKWKTVRKRRKPLRQPNGGRTTFPAAFDESIQPGAEASGLRK